MAALLRSQDALDLETAIREWQSRQNERQHGGPAPEPDEKSAVARLTAALDTLFREIVAVLSDKGKFPRDIFISLDRSRSCFSLWSDGHGVASGSLDDKFQRSRKLRQATMKTLSHLSSTLVDRLVPVAHISNPKTKGLCDQVSNILEEVSFSHVADDSSSESTSEYSTADVHELAEDLKTDVDCLIELDQMLRGPATDLEPETTKADVSLSSWAPHRVFADKIEHRFPGADSTLFSSLGMANYQRYLRCQIERDRNQVHAEQPEQVVEVTTGSKFHDSGLGSSLNPASSYAETIMSYRDGNRSIRIPPLPEEAKRGEAFPCVACGRSVIITTNSQWKRHLYLDLQPYVCLDTSCQRSDSTFSNRANWLQHLALDHGMEPGWEQIKCPLCGDEAGPGKIAITTHLGRHLEEISLSALPAALDSETNSEASGSDIDNNDQMNEDSEEELQDLEDIEVESEEELQEQQPGLSNWTGYKTVARVAKRPRVYKRGVGSQGRTRLENPLWRRTQEDEVETPNNERDLLPANSWRLWEDVIDAAGRDDAGNAPGDQMRKSLAAKFPRFSELAALSLESLSEPPASVEVPWKTLHEWELERQAQREQAMQLPDGPKVQIHNGKEAAFHRRMGEMKIVQEDAKKEVEKARAEAEEAAYQRLKAEQKAEEEERARLYAQAIAAAEEAAYKRIKAERAEEDRLRAELNAMQARRQSEAEIRDRVEAEARAKILEIEEAHRRRMEDMKAAQEQAKMEIQKAKVEAEKAACERLVAERKAEEERSRKHAEAMAAAEENARLRFEAELKAAEARRYAEVEARNEAEEEDRLKLGAALKAAENQLKAEAEARAHVEKEARQKISKVLWHDKPRSSGLVSELGNGEREMQLNHEAGVTRERKRPRRPVPPTWNFEQPVVDTDDLTTSATPGIQFSDQQFSQGAERAANQAFQNMLATLSQEQRAAISALNPDQLNGVMQRWENRRQENMAANGGQGQMSQMNIKKTHAQATREPLENYAAQMRAADEQRKAQAKARTQDEEEARKKLEAGEKYEAEMKADEKARVQFEAGLNPAELFRLGEGRQVELEEFRRLFDAAMDAAEEELARENAATTAVPKGTGYEISDTNTGVEHGERLDDWQTRRWRWTCPSCGSGNQGRRKGPVCSNCSYLVGDGDGFGTSVPEQRQPLEDEIVTEEQLQKQHGGSPEHQAAFTCVERTPQAEHQRSPKHAEQSAPDSTTNNHRNAPNSAAKYVPRELSFLEPNFGIDSHTAALKRKLNPIGLSTPADRPLSSLDSNDLPVLPPIQLGNAKGIHTTIPSLNEDNGLVDGLRDVDRDWSLITDLAEQRRRANRMAQRAYRQKLKRRLEDLERRAGAANGQGSDQSGTSKDGPLNDIPTSPAQRSLGSARDRSRDRDVDREISYGSGHDTPHPRGHDFPTGPQESAPHERDTQMRQRLPKGSRQRADDSDQRQQSDHRSLSTEPPGLQAAPGPRTTSHTRQRTPSPHRAIQDSWSAFDRDNMVPDGAILGTSEYPLNVTHFVSLAEYEGPASHHTLRTGARFDPVRNDGDALEDESWPFPRPF